VRQPLGNVDCHPTPNALRCDVVKFSVWLTRQNDVALMGGCSPCHGRGVNAFTKVCRSSSVADLFRAVSQVFARVRTDLRGFARFRRLSHLVAHPREASTPVWGRIGTISMFTAGDAVANTRAKGGAFETAQRLRLLCSEGGAGAP